MPSASGSIRSIDRATNHGWEQQTNEGAHNPRKIHSASPRRECAVLGHSLATLFLLGSALLCASGRNDLNLVWIAYGYLMGALFALIGAILSATLGPLYLIVCYYFALFCAVPAIVQIQHEAFPFASTYTHLQIYSAIIVLSLAQLCFMAGVAAARSRTRSKPEVQLENSSRVPRSGALKPQVLAVLLTSAGLLVALASGPTRIFAARFDDGATTFDDGAGAQLIHLARALAVIGLMLSIMATQEARRTSGRRQAPAGLVYCASIALVVNYPPALPRFQMLGVILAVLVISIDFRRLHTKLLFSAFATFFLLYLFPAVKDLRNGLNWTAVAKQGRSDYLLSVDFDSFKQTIDTTIYFAHAPFRWGENILGVLLFWVPRSLWTGKPIHTGSIVSSGLGYPYNNVSSPLPAEGYASSGIVGTILIMVLVGFGVGALDRVGPESRMESRLIQGVAFGYATILMRGALNAVAPMIGPAFALAIVVVLIYRKQVQNPDQRIGMPGGNVCPRDKRLGHARGVPE